MTFGINLRSQIISTAIVLIPLWPAMALGSDTRINQWQALNIANGEAERMHINLDGRMITISEHATSKNECIYDSVPASINQTLEEKLEGKRYFLIKYANAVTTDKMMREVCIFVNEQEGKIITSTGF
jgi:hypothetical protein